MHASFCGAHQCSARLTRLFAATRSYFQVLCRTQRHWHRFLHDIESKWPSLDFCVAQKLDVVRSDPGLLIAGKQFKRIYQWNCNSTIAISSIFHALQFLYAKPLISDLLISRTVPFPLLSLSVHCFLSSSCSKSLLLDRFSICLSVASFLPP